MSTEATHNDEAHATTGHYVRIAIVLTILTILEVATYYVAIPFALLVPLLLVLAGTKFALVVAYYMHLRYDSKLFSGFFFFGFTIEILLLIALMVLFGIRSG
ncbi:MAG: cytochrome C oxidase subunit IV family protein [Chloroflexi bacterium]|nr:cytochrome C oxidase subunit IV family protein [Chloroflexota bacterium]